MTREERRLAAYKAWIDDKAGFTVDGLEAAVRAYFPELAAGTHWIAPNEPTKAMLEGASSSVDEQAWALVDYIAMRDAYLNASTHQDGATSR